MRAAKAETTTIPIVFSLDSDPVQMGFIASLSQPGTNVTGVTFVSDDFEAKQLELLTELVRTAAPGLDQRGQMTVAPDCVARF